VQQVLVSSMMVGSFMHLQHHIDALTWLDMLAVLVHVSAAGFGQQHIVPEVINLHLLEVEDLQQHTILRWGSRMVSAS
jgi:hypothetical protein